jgi:mannose-6-phosphate isomerase-like protein (cupin superfamily)
VIEIKDFKGEGYQALISYGSWRVAVLRALDELRPERIHSMERHMATDEVFILVSGRVMIILGGNDAEIHELQPVIMNIGELYNIKKGAWHTVVPSNDAHIVIVENDDTCPENSQKFTLSRELAEFIQREGTAFLAG